MDLVALAQAYGLRDPNGVAVEGYDFAGNKGRDGLDDPKYGALTPRQNGSGELADGGGDGAHGGSRGGHYAREP